MRTGRRRRLRDRSALSVSRSCWSPVSGSARLGSVTAGESPLKGGEISTGSAAGAAVCSAVEAAVCSVVEAARWAPSGAPAPSSGSWSASACRRLEAMSCRCLIAVIRSFLRIPAVLGIPSWPANLRRSASTIPDSPARRRGAVPLSEVGTADAALSAGCWPEDAAAGTSLPNRLMSLTQVLPNRPETQLGQPARRPAVCGRRVVQSGRLAHHDIRCRADRHGTCSTAARVWVPAFPLRWNRRAGDNRPGERAPNSAPAPMHTVSEHSRDYRSNAAAATTGPRIGGSPPPDSGTIAGHIEPVGGETGGVHHIW